MDENYSWSKMQLACMHDCVGMCVCVFEGVCVCVCVCVWEREGGRNVWNLNDLLGGALGGVSVYSSTWISSWSDCSLLGQVGGRVHTYIHTHIHTYTHVCMFMIDWCCFYYFVRNSQVALLEALCAQMFSSDSRISGFCDIFFLCVCNTHT